MISTLKRVCRAEWKSLLVTGLGVLCPLGYLFSLRRVYILGTYLQTSLWLQPFSASQHSVFTCHYAAGNSVRVESGAAFKRSFTSAHYTSNALTFADADFFRPVLEPFIRQQFCAEPSAIESYVLSTPRCPPLPVAVSVDIELHSDTGDKSQPYTQEVSCNR